MPVNLSIKGVPDAIADRLRARAAANHRSLQRELLSIVEAAAAQSPADAGSDAGAIGAAGDSLRRGGRLRPIEEITLELERLLPRHRNRGPSSTEIIRAMRDSRYGDTDHTSNRRRGSG